jgi:ectoine hydroxylase-related dioxygenase (phytanoyl-CoA dioxygenase family)
MLDDRINTIMTALLDKSPYAVQTMLYFKPPGAREGLHQDQYYLRVQPGTCMAAWLPLDDCDEANGCMQVVPGSHLLPLLCTVPSDTTQSFTDVMEPAAGMHVKPVIMNAGDMFFFNGQMIHGSYPNTSSDRFRRSLIATTSSVKPKKSPSTTTRAAYGRQRSRARCQQIGWAMWRWVERDGKTVIEMRDNKTKSLFTEDPPLIA